VAMNYCVYLVNSFDAEFAFIMFYLWFVFLYRNGSLCNKAINPRIFICHTGSFLDTSNEMTWTSLLLEI
jgi:hypothetical protein